METSCLEKELGNTRAMITMLASLLFVLFFHMVLNGVNWEKIEQLI